jgi:hypothetical protein
MTALFSGSTNSRPMVVVIGRRYGKIVEKNKPANCTGQNAGLFLTIKVLYSRGTMSFSETLGKAETGNHNNTLSARSMTKAVSDTLRIHRQKQKKMTKPAP